MRTKISSISTFLLIFSTLTLQMGCMPDSLTKWEDDAPPPTDETVSGTTVPITYVRYPTTAMTLEINQTITDQTPSTDGQSTTFSVSPSSLPTGLSFSTSTGTISGTPTAISSETTYTITATDSNGFSASTSITIEVHNPAAPTSLSYPESTYTFTVGTGIAPQAPSAAGTITSYTITPTLPAGLSINSTTGTISGTPTAYSSKTSYQVKGSNASGYKTVDIVIGTYNSISGLKYTQNDTLKVHVLSASGFTVGQALAGASASGTIESVDTSENSIKVNNVSGYYTVGETVTDSSASSTVTTMENIYSAGETIELTPSISAGEDATYAITTTTPSFIKFNSTTGKITGEMSSAEETVKLIITATNPVSSESIAFSISQNVYTPSNLSYSNQQLIHVRDTSKFKQWDEVSSSNGALGIVKEVNTTGSFLIVDLRKGSFEVDDGLDDSYPYASEETTISEFFVITAASSTAAASFNIGDYVSNENAALAQVYSKDASSAGTIYIRVMNGVFEEGDNIDNSSTFSAAETSISKIIDDQMIKANDLILSVADATNFFPSTNDSSSNGFITSETGSGAGVINYVDYGNNKIYVRVTSGEFTFGSNRNIDYASTYAAAETTVAAMYANSVVLDSTGGASFTVGGDITSSSGSATTAGEVKRIDTNRNKLHIYVNYWPFAIPTTTIPIDDVNPYVAEEASYSSISNDNTFYLYTREDVSLTPDVKQRSTLSYTISPDLPSGLSISSSTGIISGSPNAVSERKYYTVTATNLESQTTTYSFYLQVEEHFSIHDVTDNAKSYILHKSGQGNRRTDCRITKDQIEESSLAEKDILCRLEAGELDLYQSGIKFQFDTGKGLCEHVLFAPFYFYQWQYKKTLPATTFIQYKCDCTGCPGETQTPSCVGNYTDDGGPNCDDGSYTVETRTYGQTSDTDPSCNTGEVSTSSQVVLCGGNRYGCVGGAIKNSDEFTDEMITAGVNAKIYSGDSQKEIDLTAPVKDSDSTNRALANYTVNNSCGNDSDEYTYYSSSWSSYASTATISAITATVGGVSVTYNTYSDPFKKANPFYEFHCLDGSYDLIARIRVQVRDWDRDFNAYDNDIEKNYGYTYAPVSSTVAVSSSSAHITSTLALFSSTSAGIRIMADDVVYKIEDYLTTTTVDVVPTPVTPAASAAYYFNRTSNMDAMENTDDFGNYYNDMYDWDDFYNNTSGSMQGCSSSATPVADRNYAFPEDGL